MDSDGGGQYLWSSFGGPPSGALWAPGPFSETLSQLEGLWPQWTWGYSGVGPAAWDPLSIPGEFQGGVSASAGQGWVLVTTAWPVLVPGKHCWESALPEGAQSSGVSVSFSALRPSFESTFPFPTYWSFSNVTGPLRASIPSRAPGSTSWAFRGILWDAGDGTWVTPLQGKASALPAASPSPTGLVSHSSEACLSFSDLGSGAQLGHCKVVLGTRPVRLLILGLISYPILGPFVIVYPAPKLSLGLRSSAWLDYAGVSCTPTVCPEWWFLPERRAPSTPPSIFRGSKRLG